jgi:putative ABC transport system permease protein
MVRSVTVREFFREIRKTKSRFISVALLVILAVAFFSGLRATKPDIAVYGRSVLRRLQHV